MPCRTPQSLLDARMLQDVWHVILLAEDLINETILYYMTSLTWLCHLFLIVWHFEGGITCSLQTWLYHRFSGSCIILVLLGSVVSFQGNKTFHFCSPSKYICGDFLPLGFFDITYSSLTSLRWTDTGSFQWVNKRRWHEWCNSFRRRTKRLSRIGWRWCEVIYQVIRDDILYNYFWTLIFCSTFFTGGEGLFLPFFDWWLLMTFWICVFLNIFLIKFLKMRNICP